MMTQLVGIVNATPDSFSDGGENLDPSIAVERIVQLANQGAYRIDLGAESTRPGATSLNSDEEWLRLEPVLTQLKRQFPKLLGRLSIDTRHAVTAASALGFGVAWINDVTGFSQKDMVEAVRASHCDIVVMHSLGVPANPAVHLPEHEDVIEQLKNWALSKLEVLEREGIARSRIILDPGAGFGKTGAQSLELIRRAGELKSLGARLLVGHSRKSFLGAFSSAKPQERDALTVVTSLHLAAQGVDFIRVHNVALHTESFALWGALRAD